MPDLSNSTDWLKIFDQSYVAQPNPKKVGKYLPIAPLLIPENINNTTIGVFCGCNHAKPNWRTGARIMPIVDVLDSEFNGFRYKNQYESYVNETTVFTIKKLAPTYRIEVKIPPYFLDAHIAIWVFQGLEVTDSSKESIEALRQELAQTQDILARIEYKLDAMS